MYKEDKLFNFLCSLQPWVKAELRRQSLVIDLSSMIATMNGLVDFKSITWDGSIASP